MKDIMKRIKELREKIKIERELILIDHNNGTGGLAIVKRLTSLVDHIIRKILKQALEENKPAMEQQAFAVVGVGGYGRNELSPGSDIDLLILHIKGLSGSAEYAANILVPLLWDVGFDVGHGFRAVRETIEMSRQDMTVKTNIIYNRLIWGDSPLYQTFRNIQWKSTGRKDIEPFMQYLAKMRKATSKKPLGITQPNVKLDSGGLRSLQCAFWAAYARFGIHDPELLQQRGILSKEDVGKLHQSLDFLLRVRNELHFRENKKNDTLAFEIQRNVAFFLGYRGSEQQTVKDLMRDYYLSVSNLREISDALFNRSKNYRKGLLKKFQIFSFKKIDNNLALFGNEISLSGYHPKFFEENSDLVLKIFTLCQHKGYEINHTLKRTLKSSLDSLEKSLLTGHKFQEFFLSLLKNRETTRILRMMHECGILGRFLPEFEEITHTAPYDFYHAYTIDEHTFQALSHLEDLEKQKSGILADIYNKTEKKWLAKLAILLHDVGKSGEEKSRTHSQISANIAENICGKLGITEEETELVIFLIKYHLLLNLVARRRDTHDSKTIHDLANIIETRRKLDFLYIITYADMKGVAPGVWSTWFAYLLEDLYERTADFLNIDESNRPGDEEKMEGARKKILRYLPKEIPEDFALKFLETASTRYLVSIPTQNAINHILLSIKRTDGKPVVDIYLNESLNCTEMVMISDNRRGHLNRLSGVLASQGMNILEVRIFMQRDNSSIDIIRFTDRFGKPVTDEAQFGRLQKKMVRVVENMEPPKEDSTPRSPKNSGLFPQPQVDIKNNISPTHTIVEIEADDRIGLIQSITYVLFKMGLNIHLAKIDTEGNKAIDAFYVTKKEGDPILDKDFSDKLKNRLLEML